MKRFLLVLLLVLIGVAGVYANPVDMGTVREVAVKFVNANSENPLRGVDELQLVKTYSLIRGDVAFYVFNVPHGFVIVAADDRVTPILGYSTESQFDPNNLPPQLEDYLQGFADEIQYAFDNNIQGDEQTAQQWEMVQSIGRLSNERGNRSVSPLLTDSWGQGCYYNALCPEDSQGPCGHTYTGCVATSFAQILHFWGYPQQGTGSHSYTPSGYPTQTVNFGATTYNWAYMPNQLTASSSQTQVNAVATLMWHCGVAVDMHYGPSSSGANTNKMVNALKTYFGYAQTAHVLYRSSTTNQDWLNQMKGNLDLGWPVEQSADNAAGGGHAFVCDGYDNNDMLHYNFGWEGASNGYYAVGAILGTSGYNYDHWAILDIHPSNVSGAYTITTPVLPDNAAGTVTGAGTYQEGSTCTLTAAANTGYTFVNWSKDGTLVSTNSTYSFTVAQSGSYQAFFKKNMQGDIVSIGSGTQINSYLPVYAYDCHTLSQQIYTADEICMSGDITSIAFYNSYVNGQKCRNLDIYLVHTDKTRFSSNTDWIAVTNANKVFSGDVWFAAGDWMTIELDTPFAYNGTSNLAVIVADRSTTYEIYPPGCLVTSTESMQSIYVSDLNVNFDVTQPSQYTGTRQGLKNQIHLGIENGTPVNPAPTPGGYTTEIVEIGNGETSDCYFPVQPMRNSVVTEQIYTAAEIGRSGTIRSIAFHQETEDPFTFNTFYVALKHTNKSSFASDDDVVNLAQEDIVYEGQLISQGQGWFTLTFNTPFEYDGISNLLVACIHPYSVPHLGQQYFSCHYNYTDGYKALAYYNGSNVDYTNLTSYDGSKWSSRYRNNIHIGFETGILTNYTYYTGTVSSSAVPVEPMWVDSYLKCEMVMPATELTAMAGNDISKMRFYLSQTSSISWGNANFKIFMKEVNYTQISAYEGFGNANVVYEGSLDPTQSAMDIEFSTPYHYNGGNLLIGVYNTVPGNYGSAKFIGTTVNGASVQGHSSSSLNSVPCGQKNFLPKTTFTCVEETGGGTYYTYYNVSVSANPAHGGTVTGGGTYVEGSTVTLTATAKNGYTFLNWTKNGAVVSSNTTYSFTLTGDVAYVANFEALPSPPGELIVHDGTATSSFIPIYGVWADAYNKVEMVYPASELAVMAGSSINKLTFYSGSASVDWEGAIFQVFLREVNDATISSFNGPGVVVYEGALSVVNNEMVVEFTTPYNYNGSNLLIGVYETNPGEYGGCSWIGETVTGASVQGFSTSSLSAIVTPTRRNFLPKTKFNYSDGGSVTTYQIAVSANPTAGGTVTGGGSYVEGGTATITATPNSGYNFKNWTKNGTVVSTSPTYNFTVTENAAFVANFEEIPPIPGENELTIYDESATNDKVPVYGYWADSYLKCEMVMPASNLSAMAGSNISKMKFYLSSPAAASWGSANFKVFMKEVSYSTISTYEGFNNATVVYEGSLDGTQSVMEIVFNAPYHYSGGNLLIGVYNTVTGAYKAASFYGTTVSGASVQGYSQSSLNTVSCNQANFLPKTTFTYASAGNETYYAVSVSANPAEGGMVTGGGSYLENSNVTLNATANNHYQFVNWTKNGTVVSTNPTYSFTVTEDIAFVANFERIQLPPGMEQITVHDGTVTNQCVPVYGYWADAYNKAEMVYPANELVAMSGGLIYGMTFFADQESASWGSASFKVFLKEVNSTTISSFSGPGTVVYEGGLSVVGNEMEIEFTTPYQYNGGNLLVGVYEPTKGSFLTCYWYGEEVEGASVSGYSSNSFDDIAVLEQDFLPKTTFTYSGGGSGPTYYTISVSANPADGGTVSGGGTYEEGSEITITATANNNYQFVNWTKDGAVVSENESYSFTVTEDAEFVANFEVIPLPPTGQTSELVGGWNWWSAYIEMNGIDGLTMLEESLDDNCELISSQSAFITYYQGYGWFGSLTSVVNEQMYRMKMSTPATITLEGDVADPSQHPITMVHGWSHIGFVSASSMNVSEALSGFMPTYGDMVKTQTAYSMYYGENGWYGSLNSINPGDGLMYKSNNTESVTFTYPQGSKGETIRNITADNNHWVPDMHGYQTNMTVMAVVELDGAEVKGDNYELALFSNGECRGSVNLLYVEPVDRYVAFLTITGDDDDVLSFGLYDRTTGNENFNTSSRIVFHADDMVGNFENPMVVSFGNNAAANVMIYPNPAKAGESINIAVPEKAEVEIINAVGEKVKTEMLPKGDNTVRTPEKSGVYMIRIISGDGEIVCRKVVLQ